MEKTHYRKVFKSDHLGVADLEEFQEAGSNLIFTISHVRQEYGAKVAGRKIDANIAYFQEKIKPLVLNATNSKVLSNLTGSAFVDDWQNVPVQLYIERSAKLKGEIVGGVRINPNRVQVQTMLTPENVEKWNQAKAAYIRDGNLDKVLSRVGMSAEHQKQLIQECANNA